MKHINEKVDSLHQSGNYFAFHTTKKAPDIENKHAYIIGAGLAGLAAATFLVRDAKMPGKNIRIFEELNLNGGSLDGYKRAEGYVMRGGREMEEHFECLWDLFRSIPSLEHPGETILDEYYELNQKDPNSSECRIIYNRGEEVADDGLFTLNDKALFEILKLFFTKEENLQNVEIQEVFSEDFFNSNFWIYWSTMFAFEKWHSALEMRRYILRFIHHINGLPDFKALKFTRYNQYESLVQPLVKWLKDQGVQIETNVQVQNILTSENSGEITADKIICLKDNENQEIQLTKQDYVFVTNGSITESSTYGTNDNVARVNHDLGGSWTLWKNLAKQNDKFGHPDVFCENLPAKSWFISATITINNPKILTRIQEMTKRNPLSGNVVSGGIITVKDSPWMQSWTVHRQPQFKEFPKDTIAVWWYALYSSLPGSYVKKPVEECNGIEICEEWLYHLGFKEDEILELAKSCQTVPVYMPYISSYFMKRTDHDRPLVIPEGSKNLLFIGNFAETKRDTLFTTEYSVRTAMEGVYKMFEVDRYVPEVWPSCFDIRDLLHATKCLLEGRKITDLKLSFMQKEGLKILLKKLQNTLIEQLLVEYELI